MVYLSGLLHPLTLFHVLKEKKIIQSNNFFHDALYCTLHCQVTVRIFWFRDLSNMLIANQGGTVCITVALQQRNYLDRFLAQSLSAGSLHVLPMHAFVLTGYSGFFPHSKNMAVRLGVGMHGCPKVQKMDGFMDVLLIGFSNLFVFLCVVLQWTDNLFRMYPAFYPLTARDRYQSQTDGCS